MDSPPIILRIRVGVVQGVLGIHIIWVFLQGLLKIGDGFRQLPLAVVRPAAP